MVLRRAPDPHRRKRSTSNREGAVPSARHTPLSSGGFKVPHSAAKRPCPSVYDRGADNLGCPEAITRQRQQCPQVVQPWSGSTKGRSTTSHCSTFA